MTVTGTGGSDTETKVDYITVYAPASFIVSDIDITPARVAPGETVTISAQVSNIGGVEGTCSLVLSINGSAEEARTITLGAGENKTENFSYTGYTTGDYQVAIDRQAASFTIAKESGGRFGWRIAGAIIGGLLLVLGASVAIHRFRLSRQRIHR